jgi:hypothetical protein
MSSTAAEQTALAQEERAIAEKKRIALTFLAEAWDDAIAEGVDPEILAHAALFTALADLVTIYGEEAVADLANGFSRRIRAFEFSIERRVQ